MHKIGPGEIPVKKKGGKMAEGPVVHTSRGWEKGSDRCALGQTVVTGTPIIERGFVLCSEGYITPSYLPEEFMERYLSAGAEMTTQEVLGMDQAVHAWKPGHMDALRRNNFNRLAATRDLGIHKSTLFRKMKNLGIAF
jgi:hypothetical protein